MQYLSKCLQKQGRGVLKLFCFLFTPFKYLNIAGVTWIEFCQTPG